MMTTSLGLKEALRLTLDHIKPLPAEDVAFIDSVDRIVASDLFALMDSPSVDASLKDGYAVISSELAHATPQTPARLRLVGSVAPGGDRDIRIQPGTTVSILTGGRIPTGADAVIREEAMKQEDNTVLIEKPVEPGTDILPRGIDVTSGGCILRSGQRISPGLAGLMAAAGHSRIPVFRNPVVAIIGKGDELIAPGDPLPEGKLYASNIATLAG
jgi:molybdopterin molybdotransferase